MPKILAYVWFDIEDYVTRESHDLPLKAFEILKKHNVPVTCKIVAEKVRALVENGRNDVISAISEHDVGYHLDTHSRHPTLYEYLAEFDVPSGAKEFLARESDGLAYVKQTFGRTPSCFGHPGPTWSPHVYPALPEMGIPVYLDDTPILNLNNQPYWYCGILNLNGANQNFIVFDYTFQDPNGINGLKQQFKRIHDKLRTERGAISLLFHLHTAINRKFWDEVNFGNGQNRNRDEYQRPQPQPAEITERAWKNFDELIGYMSSFDDVEFITASDAAKIYGHPAKANLDRDELRKVAAHFRASSDYFTQDGIVLSPSEAFYAVAASLSEYATSGKLPERVEFKEPLGPMTTFRSKGKKTVLTKDLLESAKRAADFADAEKFLPTDIQVGPEADLSPHDFLATASKLLHIVLSGKSLPDRINLSKSKPPHLRYISAARFRDACNWKVLPRRFKAPRILEQITLQAWTLKPAQPTPGSE